MTNYVTNNASGTILPASSDFNEFYGADPQYIKWKVVRGDTSKIRIEFWQNDETDVYDTSTWTYKSTAYDNKISTSYNLVTTAGNGYVDIEATPEITANWGTGHRELSTELNFDLQVTIASDTVWTPIIGTIFVLSDVTPVGGS
jgi:hypothetical protein